MKTKLYLIFLAFFFISQAKAQESEDFIIPDDPFCLKNAVKAENKNWIYFKQHVDIKTVLREFSQSEGKRSLYLNEEDELLTRDGTKMNKLEELKIFNRDSMVLFEQFHNGVSVEGSQLLLHYSAEGKAKVMHGKLAKNLPTNERKQITLTEAITKALSKVNAIKYAWEDPDWEQQRRLDTGDSTGTYFPKEELKYVRVNFGGTYKANNYKLSYRIVITTIKPKFDQIEVFVDAKNGDVIRSQSLLHDYAGGTLTTLYNGQQNFTTYYRGFPDYDYVLKDHTRGEKLHTLAYDGQSAWWTLPEIDDNDNKWGGYAANTHWAVQKAWDYFGARHGRNGTNNNGEKIRIGCELNDQNAYYIRDGGYDYLLFGRTNAGNHLSTLDIVGHEFTHGVTHHSAGLIYQGESGALNESFSDIFGSMVENFIEGSINWTIGEDATWTIRSMQNPNAFIDPDTYGGYYWIDPNSTSDDGGVHSNSGVQNRWFYLLSIGGNGINDNGDSYSVQGIGTLDAAKIAYRNLTRYLGPSSNYNDARIGAINSAIDLFGECSVQHIATVNAWHAVGVGQSYSSFCVSNIRASATDFCMEYNSYSATFTIDVFPSSATITWSVPEGWNYYLTNSNKTLQLTDISYPFEGTYTIGATISNDQQVITRYQYVTIQRCYNSDCESQFSQDLPCMMEAASYVENNISNDEHQTITANLLNEAKQADLQNKNLLKADNLKLYPNPARDKVFIELPKGVKESLCTIYISNTLGQIVLTQQLTTDRILEVKALTSGTYLIRIKKDEKFYTAKLIIVK